MNKKQLQAIEKFTKKSMAKTLDPQHDYPHVNKVRNTALDIVDILKLRNEIDTHLLQAACLLHDITYTKHNPGFITWLKETKYLKAMLPEILHQFDLNSSDHYILSEAVYHHTWGFPFRLLNKRFSIYSQIVQDADFIEFISQHRLLKLKRNKSLPRFYKIISLLSGLFIKRIRKNSKKYMNVPEIIEYFKEDYQ